MKLFVGLGNPGSKHARNRHNIGFMTLERIAIDAGFGNWRKRFHGLVSEGQLGEERVLLLKPETYYNDVGRAVHEAATYLKIAVDNIYVFHDEIDLAPGKLRVKVGGGIAGNRGLRSISSHMGPDFTRVRIGVGHPGDKSKVSKHVLQDFNKADAKWLEPVLQAVAQSSDRLAAGETGRFQSDIARIIRDAEAHSDAGSKSERNQSPPRSPGGRADKSATSGDSRDAGRRSAPTQMELARRSSKPPAQKPSRRIKKGAVGSNDVHSASQEAPAAKTTSLATLTERLKTWFSRSKGAG